jgi:hypothetical protein
VDGSQIFSTESWEDAVYPQPFKTIPVQKDATYGSGSVSIFTGNTLRTFLTNDDEVSGIGTMEVIGEKPGEIVEGKGVVLINTVTEGIGYWAIGEFYVS